MDSLNNYIRIPIGNLVKAAWNYKTDDAKRQKKLVANVKRNGQVENIIVRQIGDGHDVVNRVETGAGQYEVVNGNHRYDAFQEAGFVDVVAYNLGPNISDAVARRIAVETNETRFGTDDIRLAEVIRSILGEYDIEEVEQTLPFTMDELQAYNDLLDFKFSKFAADVDIEADPPKEEDTAAPLRKHTFLAPPHVADEIIDRLTQEERQAEDSADRDHILLKKRIRLRLTTEEFELFCKVFDMNEKNAYSPKLLIEYIQSQI